LKLGEYLERDMNETVQSAAISNAVQERENTLADRQRIRRAVLASGFGTIVEYFDFGLYAFFASVIADAFFPLGDRTAALLYTYGIFAASFILRPLGGILLGHVADRFGRRPALGLSVGGISLASALIGCVPSYAEIGIAAPILLLTLRFIQGLSAGGEIGGAQAYVVEVAPKRSRAYLAGFVSMGLLSGTLFGALSSAFVHTVFDARALTAWAWRLPFLISLPLGIVTLIFRAKMDESEAFQRIEKRGAVESVPVVAILQEHLRELLIVACVSAGNLMLFYMTFAYLPTYLQREHCMSGTGAAWSTCVALLGGIVTIPLWARLSDRIGRRPLLLAASIGAAVLAYPAFLAMTWSSAAAVTAQFLLGQIQALSLGVAYVTQCEMFPTRVRSTGVSLGCNLSATVVAAPAPYLATWLIPATGNVHAPALMIVVTALIAAAAAYAAKETAGCSLNGE
jgi:MHS family proline/betaine transporter-like MFS transporter